MGLKARLSQEEWSKLSEEQKSAFKVAGAEYVKRVDAESGEAFYQLEVDDAESVFAGPLKRALDAVKQDRNSLRDKVTTFAELEREGITAGKVRELQEQARELDRLRAEQQVIEEQRKQALERAVASERQVADRYRDAWKQDRLRSVALEALGPNANPRVGLTPMLERLKFVEDEKAPGGHRIEVALQPGDEKLFKDSEGRPLQLADPGALAEAMRKTPDYGVIWRAAGAGGAGAGGSGGGAGGDGTLVLSREQYRDPKAYRAARERAEKEGLQITVAEEGGAGA